VQVPGTSVHTEPAFVTRSETDYTLDGRVLLGWGGGLGSVLVIGRAASQGQCSHLAGGLPEDSLALQSLSRRPATDFSDTKRSGRLNSCEADSRLASQEIPRTVWYPKVNYQRV
jgi:hypothetical protein